MINELFNRTLVMLVGSRIGSHSVVCKLTNKFSLTPNAIIHTSSESIQIATIGPMRLIVIKMPEKLILYSFFFQNQQ